MLEIAHFDTKSGLYHDIDPEKIDKTLAEYLFPGVTYSLGTVYDSTQATELERFSNPQPQVPSQQEQFAANGGWALQFANGDRFYFANSDIRNQVFPVDSDGAAYGSLLFTNNQNFTPLEKTKILVLDDDWQKNVDLFKESGIFHQEGMTDEEAADKAKELTEAYIGDCFGRIDTKLHEQVGGLEDRAFQFRFCSRAQENDPVARIAKGTFSPMNLSQINGHSYDLIMPKSAFKGRKNEKDELGNITIDRGEIQHGEYILDVGLGIKNHAKRTKQSLGVQIWH